jgi:hypothetical protein
VTASDAELDSALARVIEFAKRRGTERQADRREYRAGRQSEDGKQ